MLHGLLRAEDAKMAQAVLLCGGEEVALNALKGHAQDAQLVRVACNVLASTAEASSKRSCR